MKPASRKGDIDTGHGCYPPRASTSGSPNVFINGIEALRVDDTFAAHACGSSSHPGTVSTGSQTVFVNGKALARIGDNVSCGSLIAQGSPNVFSG